MVNLARVQLQAGAHPEAEGWLDRAEALRSDYPAVPAVRGLLALQQRRIGAAVGALSEARARAPRDVEVLTNLAAALLQQGREAEAVEILKEAQRVDPHHAASAYNLGLAYDHSGDWVRAAHHYERFLRLASRSEPARAAVEDRLLLLRGAPEASDSIADEGSSAGEGGKEG